MDRKVLHRFFEGVASYEEEEAVCNWVDASDKNREELIRERKYFDVLFMRDIRHRNKEENSRFYLFPLVKDLLKVAVVIAFLAVSAVHVYTYMKPEVSTAYNRILVPPGQRVNLILSDGTGVWLNARSELQYPASFTGNQRTVRLKGEGYFEVKKDTKRPFVVQTKKYDITVLGTKFNAKAGESDSSFAAALMEGSIRLTDNTNPATGVLLSPNQKAEWKDGRLQVGEIDNYDDYRWKEGLICFENTAFIDLMHRFESIYDIHIVIQNKKLDNYKCSGKFRTADGVDYILQVLQRSKQFTFARDENNTIIYIK